MLLGDKVGALPHRRQVAGRSLRHVSIDEDKATMPWSLID